MFATILSGGMVESLHNVGNAGSCLSATSMHWIRCNFILATMSCMFLLQDLQVAQHHCLPGLTDLSKYWQMLSCFLPQLDMMRETKWKYTMLIQDNIRDIKTVLVLSWIEYFKLCNCCYQTIDVNMTLRVMFLQAGHIRWHWISTLKCNFYWNK